MKFYDLMKLSLELYEDQGFRCGDISKQYWLSLITNFHCIFHVFSIMYLQSIQKWIITEWLWIYLKTKYQNV